uniref:Acyl-CoA synthetase family member 2, mitochondrial n=1 Tax=Auxenochlorella protothecoides TaxID=3075 RepID=A0A1D1ZVX2_AUXPR
MRAAWALVRRREALTIVCTNSRRAASSAAQATPTQGATTLTLTQSHVKGCTSPALLQTSLGGLLDDLARRQPDVEAVVSLHQGSRLSYAGLQQEACTAAAALVSLGVEQGDRVGVWATSCQEWVIMQFATAKVGAVLVSMNPAYQTTELEYAVARCGMTHLIMSPGWRASDYVGMLQSIRAEVPTLRHVVLLGSGESAPGLLSWHEFLERSGMAGAREAARARAAGMDLHTPYNIQYTSGTTGRPKPALLSQHSVLNNGYMIGRGCRLGPADRVCIPVPLFHCFGAVLGNLATLATGGTIVFPGASFDPARTLAAVQAERCTSLLGVPTMFIRELELDNFGEYRLDSLRTGIMAGSPCPVEVMRRVQSKMHMSEVTICYGMTETSPVSFQTSIQDPIERRVSTVGHIHPHLEAKVIDPVTQGILAPGEVGELCVRGYSVMQGYYDDPEATAAAVDAEGWMHSGDLVTLDAEGYCNIVGRMKDMVIRGGENLYPREIEELLHSHPAIAEVNVFGVADARYGEELCAWVRTWDHASVSEDDIRAWAAARVSRHKVPRYIKFVHSFPQTLSGKPQKYLMRKQANAELGLDQAETVETA